MLSCQFLRNLLGEGFTVEVSIFSRRVHDHLSTSAHTGLPTTPFCFGGKDQRLTDTTRGSALEGIATGSAGKLTMVVLALTWIDHARCVTQLLHASL